MRITYLSLKGFKHVGLSGIDTFEYRIEQPLSLILGTNGSGKSSLLRELTPLPATTADYRPGGHKVIHLTHRGSQYELTSRIKRGAKHSFIKDGEELNPGGTGAIQKQLVEQEFQLTPLIQKIIRGEMAFSKMAPNQRKEILMSVSPLKLDYALSLFQKLRSAHRDTVGALRHIAVRQEEAASDSLLTSVDDIQALEKEMATLKEEVRTMLPHTVNRPTAPEQYKAQLMEAHEQLMNKLEKIKAIRIPRIKGVPESLEATMDRMERIRNECFALEKETGAALEKIAQLSELTDVVENTEEGLDILLRRREERSKELSQYQGIDGLDYGEVSLERILEALESAYYELLQFYTSRDKSLPECTPDEYQAQDTLVQQLRQKKAALETQLNVLIQQRDAYQVAREKDIECPSCHFLIRADGSVDDTHLEKHQKRIEETQKALTALEHQLEKEREIGLAMHGYLQELQTLKTILKKPTRLYPLWTALGGFAFFKTNDPLPALQKEIHRIKQRIAYQTCHKEWEDLNRTIELMTLSEQTQASVRKQALEEQVDRNRELLKGLQEEEKRCQQAIRIHERYQTWLTEIQQDVSRIADAFDQWAKEYAYSVSEAHVQKRQKRMGEIQELLSKREVAMERLRTYQKEHQILSARKQHYHQLIQAISPTTGIIAEQMEGYLRQFVDDITSVIQYIWEYDLSLKLCGHDKDELDYKFPLQVDHEIVPDVSLGSTGQREVVDFAFTIVIAGYLGLTEYPLYLDEVGSSFDTRHREKLIFYIKSLLETRQCEQLFMVNHYMAEYGSFANTDCVVLSKENIILPDTYNERVSIQYVD